MRTLRKLPVKCFDAATGVPPGAAGIFRAPIHVPSVTSPRPRQTRQPVACHGNLDTVEAPVAMRGCAPGGMLVLTWIKRDRDSIGVGPSSTRALPIRRPLAADNQVFSFSGRPGCGSNSALSRHPQHRVIARMLGMHLHCRSHRADASSRANLGRGSTRRRVNSRGSCRSTAAQSRCEPPDSRSCDQADPDPR